MYIHGRDQQIRLRAAAPAAVSGDAGVEDGKGVREERAVAAGEGRNDAADKWMVS